MILTIWTMQISWKLYFINKYCIIIIWLNYVIYLCNLFLPAWFHNLKSEYHLALVFHIDLLIVKPSFWILYNAFFLSQMISSLFLLQQYIRSCHIVNLLLYNILMLIGYNIYLHDPIIKFDRKVDQIDRNIDHKDYIIDRLLKTIDRVEMLKS